MSTPHKRKSQPRLWITIFSLLLGTAVVGCLGAMAAFLLFAYTQNNSRGSISRQWYGHFPISMAATPDQPTLTSVWIITQTKTATPYQPQTDTPTATSTPTPTLTFTPTPTSTNSPTPTSTFTPTATPSPTATDTPVPPRPTSSDDLPEDAEISGVTGYAQALPLSCESRSAVDWAAFFGVSIRELDFQNKLPTTDNPNTGFVGNPRDGRGKIPPSSYGVHAAPVAKLLRKYGLKAQSYSAYSWNGIRREVANGHPVIAWVIGNVWAGFGGEQYTASDGETLIVARYEHTVIITGYSPDSVTVIDNNLNYRVPLEQFLSSWGVLGNMVVVMQ